MSAPSSSPAEEVDAGRDAAAAAPAAAAEVGVAGTGAITLPLTLTLTLTLLKYSEIKLTILLSNISYHTIPYHITSYPVKPGLQLL